MRLKSLRKERPPFEIEGAIINGNRIDILDNNLKSPRHRSNTTFNLPISLNIESPIKTPDMTNHSRQSFVIPAAPHSSNLSTYQAIEAAYLEHGIRIRLSPTRTVQQIEKKPTNNLQRHSAFINRNPSRTSSVLHYTTNNHDQNPNYRSFSALQQTSLNDFDQTHKHNVSYAQSSQINEEIHNDDDNNNYYYSPSIIISENSNPSTPIEKIPITNDITSPKILSDNDPDLEYMSSLLKKTNEDSIRDTIRRRAGLRGTFSIHRHSSTTNSNQLQQQSREKSPIKNRNSLTRNTTISIVPTPLPQKLDKDILKHATRIRRTSQSKDNLTKPLKTDTTSISTSPLRTKNKSKQNSDNKSFKSISLEPLELLLSSTSHFGSLSEHNLPSVKTPKSTSRRRKTSGKRSKSAKISTNENSLSKERLISSSTILHDESLSLMKTSPLDIAPQSNSFDSGCYDHSSSSGDVQSLTSSSILHIQSSTPSSRLMSSTARRSNTNKKVSFYEEPTAVILTTATYV